MEVSISTKSKTVSKQYYEHQRENCDNWIPWFIKYYIYFVFYISITSCSNEISNDLVVSD